VLENRVLKRIFGPKRKFQEPGEDYIMRSFIICTVHHQVKVEMSRACSTRD
jgi:hypothetical protein